MADFNSKYTGEQVEALLDIVSQGGGGGGEGGGGTITEAEITAMGFTKNLGTVTGVKMNGEVKGTGGVVDLGAVVPSAAISSLDHLASANGFLSQGAACYALPDTATGDEDFIIATTNEVEGKVDKVPGKQLSTEDFTTNLKSKLEGLMNYNDTEVYNAINGLQAQINTLIVGNVSEAIESFNEITAFLDGIKDTEDLAGIIASIEGQIADKMDKVTLAAVATSGNYNDLTNKPSIPSAVTESTVSGWGFTKNTGTYSKPSGGIPKSDLASAVQTSLGKADTALQSYTEQYQGTIKAVDTSEEVDDIVVEYATKEYVNNAIIGAINNNY